MTTIHSTASHFSEIQPPSPSRSSTPDPTSDLLNSPKDKKLRKAATQFESLLLSTLWKSMKSSFTDPDEDSIDPAHDTIDQMGMDAMTGAVAKAGGMGIAKLILKHLEPKLAHSQNGNEPLENKVSPPPADIPE